MEPKKIKKLVLRPETIASLSGNEQNRIKGGRFATCDKACYDASDDWHSCEYYSAENSFMNCSVPCNDSFNGPCPDSHYMGCPNTDEETCIPHGGCCR